MVEILIISSTSGCLATVMANLNAKIEYAVEYTVESQQSVDKRWRSLKSLRNPRLAFGTSITELKFKENMSGV